MGAPVELGALLARYQIDLTSEEVLGEMDATFAAIPGAGAATLSAPEVDFLATHGGPSAEIVIRDWSANGERQTRARLAVQALANAVAGSISTKEAAELLRVDRSRVSRRITGKTIWAFDIHGQRRIPRWQFLDTALLPGLEIIVPAIPRDVTPAALEAFMRTPQPDFDGQTPIDYLAAGGDPQLIAGFVGDLNRW